MNSRDRIRSLLEFKEIDRIGLQDSFWSETIKRWHKEGLPKVNSNNLFQKLFFITDYFGFDFDFISMDASLRLPEKNLEVTKEYIIRQDKHGCTIKAWLKSSHGLAETGMAMIDNVIKTRQDWEKYKDRLTVDFGGTSRIGVESYASWWEEKIRSRYLSWEEEKKRIDQLRKRKKYVLLIVYGPFEATLRKYGWIRTIRDFIKDPEFIQDMFKAHVNLVIDTLRRGLREGIKADGIFLIEDMAYRKGPFFSPDVYEEQLLPFHKKIGRFLNSNDMGYFVHTDGDIRLLIPLLIEAGFDTLQPLQADLMDVRELKKKYDCKIVFMGNINISRMSGSRNKMKEEVESKILTAKEGGGYIYHSDHSVPYTCSFDDYKYLMDIVEKCGKY
jgi:uroporphyrinogen decarboxylase